MEDRRVPDAVCCPIIAGIEFCSASRNSPSPVSAGKMDEARQGVGD
jgi:hypothetical protein